MYVMLALIELSWSSSSLTMASAACYALPPNPQKKSSAYVHVTLKKFRHNINLKCLELAKQR
jgi:hypothetical protein